MNTVTFPCTCGATLQMEQKMVGMQVRCGNCDAVLVVPEPSNPQITREAATAPQGEFKVMKWHEPSIMKRVGNKAFHLWVSLGLIFGVGLAGILLRAISHQGSSPRPYWVVFLGCAGVGFAFDCVRRMLLFLPSIAIVSKEGINLNTLIGIGAHFSFWPWHSISSGKLEVVAVGYRSVRILTLYSHDQQQIGTIGMPLVAPVEHLAEAFHTMGKPLYC